MRKLQEELASTKSELKAVKEASKKNNERIGVLESLVQEETDEEEEKK